VGVALGYLDFRFPAIDWRGAHPNLQRLHDKLVVRQSFIDTVPPRPGGRPSSDGKM
jgi:glutathione S-transferase